MACVLWQFQLYENSWSCYSNNVAAEIIGRDWPPSSILRPLLRFLSTKIYFQCEIFLIHDKRQHSLEIFLLRFAYFPRSSFQKMDLEKPHNLKFSVSIIICHKDPPKCWNLFVLACLSLQRLHNEHTGIPNHLPHDCLLNRLFKAQIKENIRNTGLFEGISPMTGELPAQRASNGENVSIWWRHHNGSTSCFKIVDDVTRIFL